MPKLAINGGDKIRTEGWPGWPVTDETDKQALIEVLEGNIWGIGGEVGTKMLEEFSAFHDAQYGVAVTSGTTALETSLRAARIGPGDEVICPPYTFIATANSVIMVGAIPIFADIDADTYNLDPATAEAAITERTKAIIAVPSLRSTTSYSSRTAPKPMGPSGRALRSAQSATWAASRFSRARTSLPARAE